ncbi:O-antigen ligase [Deinococcus sp. YIM 77859]|uniref:O-antigen ligase family protein n=1 Tax=Deinococcus sp. YIM 77859 TaxID=1540221 RepID=UPI00054CD9FC|nr:O-antigen ligase family protein [Deinococcus sp. YIM 77859]
MSLFRLALALFVPLFCLSFWPAAVAVPQASLYPLRFWLLLGLVFLGTLGAVALQGRGMTVTEYLRRHPPRLGLLGGLTLLYALWVALSAATSPLPWIAWLGQPYSQFGALMLLLCLGAAALYARSAPVELVIRACALTTLAMFVLALAEAVGWRPLAHLISSPRMTYPAGTVGLRQHLGGWFAIMALAPVFFFRRRPRTLWFWSWLLSGLLGVSLCTNTAATLGVALGLALWLLLGIFRRAWVLPLLTASLFAVSTVAFPPLITAQSKALGLLPPHFKDYGSTQTFTTRLYLWRAAWRAAQTRPLLGWGDETFASAVYEHLSPSEISALLRSELGLDSNYHAEPAWPGFYLINPLQKDRQYVHVIYVHPHNIWLDEVYAHGFVGAALALLTAALFLWRVWQQEPSALIPLLVAVLPYTVFLTAWFYVATVTPLFFLLLGTALADVVPLRSGPHRNAYEEPRSNPA